MTQSVLLCDVHITLIYSPVSLSFSSLFVKFLSLLSDVRPLFFRQVSAFKLFIFLSEERKRFCFSADVL